MNETTSTFSTGTLQAWLRLPKAVQLVAATVAAIAICGLGAVAINTPSGGAAIAKAAGSPMTTSTSTRDQSVPEVSQALSTEERPEEASTPTF